MKQKHVVIIGVEGGVASYEAIPADSVEVVLIDWDNLGEGEDFEDQFTDAKELIETIKRLKKTLKKQPKGYFSSILKNLKEVKARAEDALGADANC